MGKRRDTASDLSRASQAPGQAAAERRNIPAKRVSSKEAISPIIVIATSTQFPLAGQRDWHEVVDLRDCHLVIGEQQEARLEDAIIERLQAGWKSRVSASELTTSVTGSGLRFTDEDIRFKESDYGGHDDFYIVIRNFYTITPAGRKYELGHYFLPGHPDKLFPSGSGLHQSRSGFISDDPLERQADHFASALLMPEALFTKAMNRAGLGFTAIEFLANQCKTSITSTAIRYAQFTWDTVAVIVSNENRVEYCFLSEQLQDLRGLTWLKKGDVIPRTSTTAAFNKTPSNIAQAKKEQGSCYLDEWLDGAPGLELNEDVVGLGTYGKILTVLFTDDDLGREDESEEEEDELPSQRWKR
jgi:IrrE N-terminal-like domain